MERIALAFTIGCIAGYLLARHTQPETMTLEEAIADLVASGELGERNPDMICETRIEDDYG